MKRPLAPAVTGAYHGRLSRAFQAMRQPVGVLTGENLEPLSCAVFGRPVFFVVAVQKGVASQECHAKLYTGSRKPSSRSGSAAQSLNPYCVGQGCSEYAGTVLTHGGPVNKLGLQMRLSSPWPRPIAGNTGSRKPVHLEAPVANLSPRGGVSLPKLTLPRLSYSGGCLAWEFRCGHTAAVPKPFPPGISVVQAARSAACPTCAHLEALVARRRSPQEVAHV